MGRRKSTEDIQDTSGEQMALIDVAPEHLTEIKPLANKYRAAVNRRMKALEEEMSLKQEILDLIKKENLSRLPDGSIKFKCDGMTITVTPRDELVKVKEAQTPKSEPPTRPEAG